ncbi:uncharacterized protein LOC112692372 isoform X2 [Sipha flava]|nr:uncharacterized protein LOC112692372 isoform X2 [Sipha flava]
MFLVESIESCDKLGIKNIIVTICGLKKRSSNFNNVWPVLPLRFASDIEQEYQKMVDDFDEEDLLIKISDEKKPRESTVKPQRPSHLSVYSDRMRNRIVPRRQSNQDVNKNSVRNVDQFQKIIQECCIRKCTIEDIRGFCDKK